MIDHISKTIKFVFFTTASLWFGASSTFAAVTIDKVTGSISRESTTDSFSVEIILNGISKLKSGTEKYAHRLKIYIVEHNPNSEIPLDDVGTQDQRDKVNFTLSYAKDETVEVKDTKLVTATIDLKFKGKGTALKDTLAKNGGKFLTLHLKYTDAEGTIEKSDVKIEKETGVANEVPESVELEGSFRSLVIRAAEKDSIAFTAGSNRAPTGLNLYVFEAGQGVITLPAVVNDAAADTDTREATCTVNTDAVDGEDCVSCSPTSGDAGAGIYILNEKIDTSSGKIFLSESNTLDSVSVLGLENESEGAAKEYVSFVSYRPDGVKRSVCLVGTPSDNLTWSELVDPNLSPALKDPRCFIATAAYGTTMHKDVELFRRFRDQYLLSSTIGRFLVKTYYRWSPPLADFVAAHEWARKLTLSILYPLARSVEQVVMLEEQI